MRALAVLSIGGAFKLVLVVRELDGSAITTVLAALAGLAMVALLWTVGECAAALRDLTIWRLPASRHKPKVKGLD